MKSTFTVLTLTLGVPSTLTLPPNPFRVDRQVPRVPEPLWEVPNTVAQQPELTDLELPVSDLQPGVVMFERVYRGPRVVQKTVLRLS